jgi:zinc D-Ala-D-Ala carboxypeptidase
MSIAYLTGKFDLNAEPTFVKVSAEYASGPNMLMRKESYEDFRAMFAAALKEGVRLTIVSAARSFEQQKVIWERKWQGRVLVGGKNLSRVGSPLERARAILSYSAMPTTSRHHWGTDVDIITTEESYFTAGPGKKVYAWLSANAASFGFGQPYTPKGAHRPHGYKEEHWHWSHLPVASELLREFEATITYEHIDGFRGAEVARELLVIERYVLGVSPGCR